MCFCTGGVVYGVEGFPVKEVKRGGGWSWEGCYGVEMASESGGVVVAIAVRGFSREALLEWMSSATEDGQMDGLEAAGDVGLLLLWGQ